jgi:hypothetical protein
VRRDVCSALRGCGGHAARTLASMAVVAALVASCRAAGEAPASQADVTRQSPPTAADARSDAAHVLRFSQDCSRCMRDPAATCDAMAASSLVAVADSPREMHVVRSCAPDTGGPNAARFCSALTTIRFADVRPVRDPGSAAPTDVYRSSHHFDYWFPEERQGVFLHGERRYVVFANRAHPRITPKADWDIVAACEIASPAPEDPGHD